MFHAMAPPSGPFDAENVLRPHEPRISNSVCTTNRTAFAVRVGVYRQTVRPSISSATVFVAAFRPFLNARLLPGFGALGRGRARGKQHGRCRHGRRSREEKSLLQQNQCCGDSFHKNLLVVNQTVNTPYWRARYILICASLSSMASPDTSTRTFFTAPVKANGGS